MQSDATGFAAAVRAISEEARRMGFVVPGFRSPPKIAGASRTIRRGDGVPMIAVRIRGRPFGDVVADIVDGILVANDVASGRDLRIRCRLVAAVEASSRWAA